MPDGQLSIVPVAGDHYSMVVNPHVVGLGAALSHAIRQASRGQPALLAPMLSQLGNPSVDD